MNDSGDLIWEQIIKDVEKSEHLKVEITNELINGRRCFQNKNLKQEGFVHPSSKLSGELQFSYFDSHGAVGDLEASDEQELASKLVEMNFLLCDEKDFKYSLLGSQQNLNRRVNQAADRML